MTIGQQRLDAIKGCRRGTKSASQSVGLEPKQVTIRNKT